VGCDVIAPLTDAQVDVITFTPHTTQIFQVLDVTLFDALTLRPTYELPFEDKTVTVAFIMKGYHEFNQAIVEPNI
jgi:hypothetical protein